MSSDSPPANQNGAAGLPPVVPPSGRHIVQMFVVPGLIAAGLVGLLLLFMGCSGFWGAFFGIAHSPEEFIGNLENPNPDVRWRAANDLAQVLKRDDTLASDPKLALKLTELLNQALDERDRDERLLAEQKPRNAGDQPLEDKNRKAQRKYIQFLSSCLGNLCLPVGAPVVARVAKKEAGPNDPVGTVLRRHATWVLANMGENRRRFDSLPADRRAAVLAQLEQEAESTGPRSDWARRTLGALKGTSELGVIRDLDEISRAEAIKNDSDPFLRRMLAFALTFWEGTPAENAVAEDALDRLARDNGRGNLIDVSDVD
jgi:hypothetical protein